MELTREEIKERIADLQEEIEILEEEQQALAWPGAC